jgi:radical SAM superfamily enzyme YgiQ (UPF0313 family)
MAKALVVLAKGKKTTRIDATRVRFSAHQCFALDGGADDLRCLGLLIDHLASFPGLAVAVDDDSRLLRYILKHYPSFRDRILCAIVEKVPADGGAELAGIPVALAAEMPDEVQTVFLCETRTYPRLRMKKWLGDRVPVVDPDVLPDLGLGQLPARAWVPWARDVIYPIDLPDIEFRPGMDVIVIDCPARNLGLMPNGLGYVHNALKQVEVAHQTCDLDILLYHRFHVRRLFDEGGKVRLPGGRELPTDPWQAEHYDLWSDPEVIAYFEPEIREITDKLVAARPRVLGLSVHACNEKFSTAVVERVKALLPETVILVGGFACYSPDIGLRGFPLADYMCIGEADLTVGPLAERLARGERPANVPGVLSRFDNPDVPFLPAPMVHDLDLLDHPRYDWYDLDVYQNYNGYRLTPVIASRGCRWSRCTFCAERFYWRIRSPESFVDELEWLVDQGCRLFMFNESDLNGRPETVLAICDEIIRRGLQIKLTGQLRIHRKCDRAFFRKLRAAGFVALRFGVDAFSENALRLQKKGYTTADVSQNLRDCWEAGIFTEVNWVIGVPGETEEDIEEGIALILENKPWIGRLANINPLILSTGSVYWMEPEKHKIRFRAAKEDLYRDHPRAIPAQLWYSDEPYVDDKVRKRRFEHIVRSLHRANFGVGAWAERVIDDVEQNRDAARVGSADPAEPDDAPERGPLSAGVGQMEPAASPSDGDGAGADAARAGAGAFRAGSSLPEDATYTFRTDVYIVSAAGELYGIEAPVFEGAFGPARRRPPGRGCGTVDLRREFSVRFVRTTAAAPELIQSVGAYNIVVYDGLYYGIPQVPSAEWPKLIERQLRENGAPSSGAALRLGRRILAWKAEARRRARALAKRVLVFLRLRRATPTPAGQPGQAVSTPWGDVDVARLPGVITGANLNQVIAEVKRVQGLPPPERRDLPKKASPGVTAAVRVIPLPTAEPPARAEPRLVGSLEGYNVVEYEGWFYGLPQALGDLHLDKVDVLEMPGVLRDLSREVVEGEIRELTQLRSAT